jgi:hypothetical protein
MLPAPVVAAPPVSLQPKRPRRSLCAGGAGYEEPRSYLVA